MGSRSASSNLEPARARLRREQERLERTLGELGRERDDDGPIDILSGDAGASTSDAATNLGLTADLQHELDEVRAALQRIEAGTYGIDEETGEPIDPERLEAQPTARTNIRR